MKSIIVMIVSALISTSSFAAQHSGTPGDKTPNEGPAFAAVALYDHAKKQAICIAPVTNSLMPNIRGAKAANVALNSELPRCNAGQMAFMQKSARLHYGEAEARQAGVFTTGLMIYYGVCTVMNLAATQSNFPNGGNPIGDAALMISITACLPVSGLNAGMYGLASMIYYQVKPIFVKENKRN